MTAQERADAMSEFYIPVTPEAGRLLYALVRATRPTTVVEFGMSFGISAVHLASAVRDNGTGRVVTTELSATKIAAAKQTFADTGLDDVITILEGDALSTLADLDGPVEFVLLDGWKDLYLPVIKLLEPRLSTGALVVADNTRCRGHAALSRPRAQPRERLRELQLPRPGERQHGNQLPHRRVNSAIAGIPRATVSATSPLPG